MINWHEAANAFVSRAVSAAKRFADLFREGSIILPALALASLSETGSGD
jgi:hypothetical protein